MATYIYNGNVAAQQLFDINKYKNTLPDNVLRSVLRNVTPSVSTRHAPSSIPADIVSAYNNNYGSKVERYYQYGKNSHPDFIPTNYIVNRWLNTQEINPYNTPHPDIINIINNIEGESIDALFYIFGNPYLIMFINDFIINNNNYALESPPITENIPLRFINYNISPTNIYIPDRYELNGSIITVYYYQTVYFPGEPPEPPDFPGIPGQWRINSNIEYTMTIDISSYNVSDIDTALHQVMYRVPSTGAVHLWVYDENDGLYPGTIDGSAQSSNDADIRGGYPYAMIIVDRGKVSEDALGIEYKQHTNNMLDTIGLNLDTLMEAMDDPDDPDVLADVTDAFLLYSVNLDNQTDGTLQYLYEHYKDYYENNFSDLDTIHAEWVADPNNSTFNTVYFAGAKVGFNMLTRWVRITLRTGNVDNVSGAVTDLTTLNPYNGVPIDPNNTGTISKINDVYVGKVTSEIIIGTEASNFDSNLRWSLNTDQFIIRKQLNTTEYIEILLFGLQHVTILNDYANGGDQYIYHVNTLRDVQDGKMFLPLSYNSMQQFNSFMQGRIFYESLTIVIHTFQAIKLPWYADAKLWLYVRVFVFIITFGTSEAWAQGFWEVLRQLITNYVSNILLSAALTALVDVVGGEVALIIAAIAATISIYNGGSTNLDNIFGLISAEQLMQGATALINAINANTANNFEGLERYAEEQAALLESGYDALEELKSQLTVREIDIIDSVTRQPIQDFYETPDNFFNRTIHLTNPGVLSLDVVDVYTQNLLKLPKHKNITLTKGDTNAT